MPYWEAEPWQFSVEEIKGADHQPSLNETCPAGARKEFPAEAWPFSHLMLGNKSTISGRRSTHGKPVYISAVALATKT